MSTQYIFYFEGKGLLLIMKKRLLAGITALAVVLSSGVAAFAATDTTDFQIAKAGPPMMVNLTDEQREAVFQAHTESMQEAVDALVENGTITQDIADKLSEVQITNKARGGIDDLTEEQREALSDAMKEAVAKLIEDGTLTEDQADRIAVRPMVIKAVQNCDISGLTEEQRTALHETRQAKLESRLADLVEDGTLTQELADQLKSDRGNLRMGPGGKLGKGFGGRPDCPISTDTE